MPTEIETVGVFLPADRGVPVALFRDADQAQRFRRTLDVADEGVVLPAGDFAASDDARLVFDGRVVTPPAAPVDPDAEEKGRIRAELEAQERRERLTAEVKAEMEAESKAEAKAERAGATPEQVERARAEARTAAAEKADAKR